MAEPQSPQTEESGLLQCAQSIALAAGHFLKQMFRSKVTYEVKKDRSFVSSADLQSHQLILQMIGERFPHHFVLSEEDEHLQSGVSSGLFATRALHRSLPVEPEEGSYIWVVDPLDGTSNFLHGLPYFNVTLGCVRVRQRRPLIFENLVGVIYNPISDELYSAERGKGAFQAVAGESRRLEPLTPASLQSSFVACGFRGEPPTEGLGESYVRLISQVEGSRRLGSAALDIAKTAEGIFQVFFDAHVRIWDVIAGALLIEELGGVCLPFPRADLSESSPLENLAGAGLICGCPQATEAVHAYFRRGLASA